MKVNVAEFLEESGITEPFYPGKRLVHPCKQLGEYKNHSVVLDWRDPGKIKIEIKAGLSGKDLEPKILKNYPVCFQAPTFVDIEIINDNEKSKKKDDEEDDEEDEETGKGKSSSGSGGKKPAKKKLSEIGNIANAFGEMVESKIPELAKIKQMVVMGKEIAAEAFEKVFDTLKTQISHAKVSATELLAKAGGLVTKFMPPSFMEPKGDETAAYNYDREKNENIGYNLTLG